MATQVGIGLIGAGRIGASHARLHRRARARSSPGRGGRSPAGRGRGAHRPARWGTPLRDPTSVGHRRGSGRRGDRRGLRGARRAGGAGRVAGKPVFCEKPMGMDLAEVDRAISAAGSGPASPCRSASTDASTAGSWQPVERWSTGVLGDIQLLRSLTRDPGLANPAGVQPWTIFTPDPDPRLRHAQLAEPGGRAGRGVRHRRCPDRPRLRRGWSAGHRRGGDHATTTGPARWPRRASRPPTATTSAARCSAPGAW